MSKNESEGGKAREGSILAADGPDGVVDGDDAAFALPLDRGFSRAKAPVADDENGETARSAIDDIGPETWTPPFYLRYRLATAGGVVLSGAWLAASAYFIDRQILWPDLMALLPHEMGGWQPAC